MCVCTQVPMAGYNGLMRNVIGLQLICFKIQVEPHLSCIRLVRTVSYNDRESGETYLSHADTTPGAW